MNQIVGGTTHLSREDLAQAGAVALVRAADAYEEERGIPFGAYARERILGAMRDEMRNNDWAKRSTRTIITKTNEAQATLTTLLGRNPTVAEVATALGVDRITASENISLASRTVSTIDTGIEDYLVSDEVAVDEQLIIAERLKYLRASVKSLPEKMQYIIGELFFNDRSVGELAEELGITHSAVSQQRAEAIKLLKEGMVTYDPENVTVDSGTSRLRKTAFMASFAENLPEEKLDTRKYRT